MKWLVISAWERYKGFLDVYKESQSLKGFAKMKFNKNNEEREQADDRSAKEHEHSRSSKHNYYER